MISLIEVGNETINLRLPSEENIFDIDSISLLVGINGSGKTQTLHRIFKKIEKNNTESNIRHSLCEIYDICGEKWTNDEVLDWGAIYYTPLKNSTPLYINHPNVIDASNSVKPVNLFNKSTILKKTLAFFGIEPRVMAQIKLNYTDIVEKFIDSLLTIENDKFLEFMIEDFGIKRFYEHSKYLERMRARFEKKEMQMSDKIDLKNRNVQNFIFSYNRTNNIKKSKRKSNIANRIINEISKNRSNLLVFSLFCVIEELIKSEKLKTSEFIIVFIKLFPDVFDNSFFTKKSIEYEFKEISLTDIIGIQNDAILIHDFFNNHLNYPSKHNSNFDFNSSLNKDIVNYININIFGENELRNPILSKYSSVHFSNMSSGELSLIEQFHALALSVNDLRNKNIKNIILLIDEGDAFLHLDWQRKYVYSINLFLSKLKSEHGLKHIQVILASHSPILATDIPKKYISHLNKDNNKETIGFAAPLFKLLNNSFNTKTIGMFSSEKINKIIDNIKSNKVTKQDLYLIEQIDNDLVKNEIKNLMLKYLESSQGES